ncbi:tRNA-dihydrouridine synthase family protein [Chitinivibrio alkaliphilus]|uniref:tRNA-dihydrouridine synthase n=1 Tax=Chitinivibrio alkaliphilus ACht1 TaxID=1313304 RepID=U7D9F8_9BACT|nr:tRNA-dihydrouridine synthase family protein [Chitinivibrio alkaliphilus]ERP31045.1 dihydrouridine synthase DuS [Chitinivibrio alkaliphilus ACht1]
MKYYLAPMVGLTHSAFRRLIAEYNSGEVILYTEMLSPRALLHHNVEKSPYTKRVGKDVPCIYQLMLREDELDLVLPLVEKLRPLKPYGIDINLGCPAPKARRKKTGSRLFEDLGAVERCVAAVQQAWSGRISLKCRLGVNRPGWEEHFTSFLDTAQGWGIDSITLHPRFREDKRTRPVKEKYYTQFFADRSFFLIGNGNITDTTDLSHAQYAHLNGVMIGRAAVCRPWVFSLLDKAEVSSPEAALFCDVWERFFRYVREDFHDSQGLGRMKIFTRYFAQNFRFGHTLYGKAMGSTSMDELYHVCMAFLEKEPPRVQKLRILEQ